MTSMIQMVCPTCGTRLRIRSELAGKQRPCPKCRETIQIPRLEFAQTAPPTSDLPEGFPNPEPEGYGLAAPLPHATDDEFTALPIPPVHAAVDRTDAGYLSHLADVREEAIPNPPRYTFFSGVWNFLWYPEIRWRWCWLFAFGTLTALIPTLIWLMLESMSGYALMGIAFFVLPQIWLVLWTFSYAAACGTVIFEETAGGNDHISGWVASTWNEWAGHLYYVGFVASLTAALGYIPVYFWGGNWEQCLLGMVIAEIVLFPVCFLSVESQGSFAALISWELLIRSLRAPLAWLQFYVWTGVLLGSWVGAVIWLGDDVALAAILINGLAVATLPLMYARLLGRLAWVLSDTPGKRRSKRKQKPPASPPLEHPQESVTAEPAGDLPAKIAGHDSGTDPNSIPDSPATP